MGRKLMCRKIKVWFCYSKKHEATIRVDIHTGGEWKRGINGDGKYINHTSSHSFSMSSLTEYVKFLSKVKESFDFQPNDLLEVRYVVTTGTGTAGILISREADYHEFIQFVRIERPSVVTLVTEVLNRPVTIDINLHRGEWCSGINGNGKYVKYTSSHRISISSLTTYADFLLKIRQSFDFKPNDFLEVRYVVPGTGEKTAGILIEAEAHYPEFINFALANRENAITLITDVLYNY